jgi:hypothetical protein
MSDYQKVNSGGAVTWSGQPIKTWSKTQPILALSTGESELAAVVRAAAEGLVIRSLLADVGHQVEVKIESDATAAIGRVKRQGLEKVRHLAVVDLWIQQRVAMGDLVCSKIAGTENPADMMTKGLGKADIDRYLEKLQVYHRTGRSAAAPQLKSPSG